MKTITGKTKITGIFGFPIEHTLSPSMHNAAFSHLNLDFRYLPFEVTPENLKNAVASIIALNIRGINVTVPHKENVIKFLDKVDPLALKIGSVNTVVNENGKLEGYNTDGRGFLKDLINNGINPNGKTILLIGAGGAGRAIAHTLSFYGAKKIIISDKDEKKASILAKEVKNANFEKFSHFQNLVKDAAILVNATPVGMHKGDPSVVKAEVLHNKLFIYDVVYNRKSALLSLAKKKNIKHADGLGMLLNQGALAFELWTGKKAPVNIMAKAIKTVKG